MVGETRLEQATPASQTQCSTKLNYSPMVELTRIELVSKNILLITNLILPYKF